MYGLGACPAGMTYATAWSIGSGQTYPAVASPPGMCLAPVPACGECQIPDFSAPAADGTTTASCTAFPDSQIVAALKQAQANPSLMPAGQTFQGLITGLVSQAGLPASSVSCINDALGIPAPASGSSFLTDTSIGSIPNWALLAGGGLLVLLLVK